MLTHSFTQYISLKTQETICTNEAYNLLMDSVIVHIYIYIYYIYNTIYIYII